jgi:septum site-determining protein MinC
MSDAVLPRRQIRFLARSYLAFILSPEPPIFDWLTELDAWIERSPDFFAGRPVVLDVAALTLSQPGIAQVIAELARRDIRVMGVEGAKLADLGPDLPPILTGGRTAAMPSIAVSSAADAPRPSPTGKQEPGLVLDSPVRSGQSIVFPAGDVTVLGSVASGAEIIAGGSIHVYGALRGRALAGSNGNPRARIFCNKVEAELLAIDGFYRTADDMEPSLRSRPIQAWLQGEVMLIAPLN